MEFPAGPRHRAPDGPTERSGVSENSGVPLKGSFRGLLKGSIRGL